MAVRVLLIDESIFARDTLRQYLECSGCEIVAEAENTLQALDLFRTVQPAMVVLDAAVPQTGGIGALALFRIMRREIPMIPILVMSSLAFPEIRKSFMKEGALDYLSKPLNAVSFDHLRTLLREAFPETAGTPQTNPLTRAAS